MQEIGSDEVVRVKIITAGDEISLEEKINGFMEEHPGCQPLEINVRQVEYHARTGSIDFGLIAVLVLKLKKTHATGLSQERANTDF